MTGLWKAIRRKSIGAMIFNGALLLGLQIPVAAQIPDKDSLLTVWMDNGQQDTSRFLALSRLVFHHFLEQAPDSAWALTELQYNEAMEKEVWRFAAQALNMQGVILNRRGDPVGAFERFNRSFDLYERSGYRKGLAAALTNAAQIPIDQGYTEKALVLIQKASLIYRELGDEDGEMLVLGQEAALYSVAGDTDKALEIDRRILSYKERRGDVDGEVNSLINIGVSLTQLGRTGEAMEAYERALMLAIELRNDWDQGMLLLNMGYVFRQEGRLQESMDAFDRSIALLRKLGYASTMISALQGSGRTLLAMGRAKEALVRCEEGLDLAQAAGRLHEVKDACECLYEAHRQLGDDSKALAYVEQARAAADSLQYQSTLKALRQAEFRSQLLADSLRVVEEKRALQDAADSELRAERDRKLLFMGGVAGLLVLALLLWRRLSRTRREKAQSDEILHSVLPEEIAREIRETGQARNRHIDQVSVLFTDFQGFTELSAQISQQELTDEITACFTAFDGILARYQVDKIKTIGDAYLAASGLKAEAPDAAERALRAALEMQVFVEARHSERTAHGLPAFRMRVGIHTGPVVAGIVGVKKFQYDIWGDTVNMASRLESSGEVGKVNISSATYELVKYDPAFTFTSRGLVSAKGKGEVEMWFVEGVVGSLDRKPSVDAVGGNQDLSRG